MPARMTAVNRLGQPSNGGSGEWGMPLRILVADDEQATLEQLARELRQAGHEVPAEAGRNGKAALAKV